MALIDETTVQLLDYIEEIVNNSTGPAPPYTAPDMVAVLKDRIIPKTYADVNTRGGIRPTKVVI